MKPLFTFILSFVILFSSAQNRPAHLKPVLTALQVENLDSSIHFYTSYLGFNLSERKAFPDYKMEMAFLKNNEFELELVKHVEKEKSFKGCI